MEIKDDINRSEDCMKNFCESLKVYIIKIIDFEQKKMIALTNKELE